MKRLALFLLLFLLVPVALAGAARDPQIVGGQDAAPGSWPFYVALSEGNGVSCGGQLVDPQWVLTAAHCVWFGSPGKLVPGLESVEQIKSLPSYKVKNSFIHPGHRLNDVIPWDAALIRLDRPAPNPVISLASESPAPNSKVMAGGFGSLGDSGKKPRVMQEVELNVVSDEECRLDYGSDLLAPSHICVTAPAKGACHGDSGGPLVYEGTLIGLTSKGKIGQKGQCGFYPTVYTEAASIKSWVDQIINTGWQPGRFVTFGAYSSGRKGVSVAAMNSQRPKRVTVSGRRLKCSKHCRIGKRMQTGYKGLYTGYSFTSLRLSRGKCAKIRVRAQFVSPDKTKRNSIVRKTRVCNRGT